MSIQEEDFSLIGDDSFNLSSSFFTAIAEEDVTSLDCEVNIIGNDVYFSQSNEKENIKVERVGLDEDDPCMHVSQFVPAGTLSLEDVLPLADISSSINIPSWVDFTSKTTMKEEEMSSDEMFESAMESPFSTSTDNLEDFWSAQLFQASDETIASELGLQVSCRSWDPTAEFANVKCVKEQLPHVEKHGTYYYSSDIKVRDVRVLLVDLFPKNSKQSPAYVLNHTKSCRCVLCAQKFAPEKKGSTKKAKKGLWFVVPKNGLKDGQWYLCSACPARFVFAHSLKAHSVMDHGVHLCLECCIRFGCDSDLQTHLKVHQIEQYLCVFCKSKSKTEAELEVHRKTHSNKCFSCAECNIEFSENHSLLEHISKHADKGCVPKLKIKRENSPEKKLLSDHLMHHKNKKPLGSPSFTNEMPFARQKCPATFKKSETLKKHALNHNNQKYTCKYCPAEFKKNADLRFHMRNHTHEFSCTFCPCKFKGRLSLTRHLRTHVQFSCVFCPAKFPNKYRLQVHLMDHKGEAVKCEQCPSIFQTHSGLRKHLKIHFKGKPSVFNAQKSHNLDVVFSCAHCVMTFKCKQEIRRHVGLHSVQNQFSCRYCSAKFKYKCKLKEHMQKRHFAEKSFSCTVCSAKFQSNRGLKVHVVIHSKKEKLFKNSSSVSIKEKQIV